KGLARNLAASETAAISEGGQKNGVDRPALLKNIEHLLHTFIDKGDGANLNADHFSFGRRFSRASPRRQEMRGNRSGSGDFGGGAGKLSSRDGMWFHEQRIAVCEIRSSHMGRMGNMGKVVLLRLGVNLG